jgi:hypothetical protein
VALGLAREPPVALRTMGVDEKAVGHGYATVVDNLEMATVEWIGEDRKKETLESSFQSLGPEQRSRFEAVGLDLWGLRTARRSAGRSRGHGPDPPPPARVPVDGKSCR